MVGGYDADDLHRVGERTLGEEHLLAHGAAAGCTFGLYRLLHTITEPDLAVQERD